MSVKLNEMKTEKKSFFQKLCGKKGLQKPPLDLKDREECV